MAQANPDVSRQLIPADQPHGGSRVAVGSTLVRPAPMVRGACTPHQLGFQLFQLDSFDGSLPQHREFQPSVHNLRLIANPLLISAPHSRVGRGHAPKTGDAELACRFRSVFGCWGPLVTPRRTAWCRRIHDKAIACRYCEPHDNTAGRLRRLAKLAARGGSHPPAQCPRPRQGVIGAGFSPAYSDCRSERDS